MSFYKPTAVLVNLPPSITNALVLQQIENNETPIQYKSFINYLQATHILRIKSQD